jgi:hypothetical protein
MKFLLKWLILIYCGSLTSSISNAQVKKQFALGISGGYKLNSGCFLVNYNLFKKITLSNTFSLDKYQGFGIGVGVLYYPLENVKIKPYLSTSFTHTLGTQVSYGEDNNPTIFKVMDANYLALCFGLKYDDIGENKKYKNYFSYFFQIGYKISTAPPNLYYSGPSLNDRFIKIDKYINNSIVASLGLQLNIPSKHK